MQNSDRNAIKISNIIPFSPRKASQKNVSVTTIASIIAVSVLHSDDENPEDKLMTLIESSGEVEILDALDATDDIEVADQELKRLWLPTLNDNIKKYVSNVCLRPSQKPTNIHLPVRVGGMRREPGNFF